MIRLVTALDSVFDAAREVFELDPRVRSLGVARGSDGAYFVAVRNVSAILPQKGSSRRDIARFKNIPVEYQNSTQDPELLVRVPVISASASKTNTIPEQQSQRPLHCGLEIQPFDDDVRTNTIADSQVTQGTLGCFVDVPGAGASILSNNHVIAGQNRGVRGTDRITQPATLQLTPANRTAILTDFEPLRSSPANATPANGKVVYNQLDAAVAQLDLGVLYLQAYLPGRTAKPPKSVGVPQLHDLVHKVGRTTGLTYGKIEQIGVVVGPILYDVGDCWFSQSFIVRGVNGSTFSAEGDSGSAIVRDGDGAGLGLLYAGNGTETYCCPLALAMARFKCTLSK